MSNTQNSFLFSTQNITNKRVSKYELEFRQRLLQENKIPKMVNIQNSKKSSQKKNVNKSLMDNKEI